ncbi:MAG: hypothetical protein ACLPKE_26665, partial [Streptosporangiaceae bacterium]
MTKATSETTKLNFITDQGSTRATVRWACRAERLEDYLGPPGDRAGAASGGVLVVLSAASGATDGAAAAAADAAASFVSVSPRRKFRAGDDGELAGGSGIS